MPRVVASHCSHNATRHSVPNVLDCVYRLALKSCCEAVGDAAPSSLRVRAPDVAYGTRRAQLA